MLFCVVRLIWEYMCSSNVNNDTEHVDKLRYIAQWSVPVPCHLLWKGTSSLYIYKQKSKGRKHAGCMMTIITPLRQEYGLI